MTGTAGRALLSVVGPVCRAQVPADGRALYRIGGREADGFYRDRGGFGYREIVSPWLRSPLSLQPEYEPLVAGPGWQGPPWEPAGSR